MAEPPGNAVVPHSGPRRPYDLEEHFRSVLDRLRAEDDGIRHPVELVLEALRRVGEDLPAELGPRERRRINDALEGVRAPLRAFARLAAPLPDPPPPRKTQRNQGESRGFRKRRTSPTAGQDTWSPAEDPERRHVWSVLAPQVRNALKALTHLLDDGDAAPTVAQSRWEEDESLLMIAQLLLTAEELRSAEKAWQAVADLRNALRRRGIEAVPYRMDQPPQLQAEFYVQPGEDPDVPQRYQLGLLALGLRTPDCDRPDVLRRGQVTRYAATASPPDPDRSPEEKRP